MKKNKLLVYTVGFTFSFFSMINMCNAITYNGEEISDLDCVPELSSKNNCVTYWSACVKGIGDIEDICRQFGYNYGPDGNSSSIQISNSGISYEQSVGKIFNENSTLCASSSNTGPKINYGSVNVLNSDTTKYYGPVQVVETYPGGHYKVYFQYNASISMEYLFQEDCSFARLSNGRIVSCGRVGAIPSRQYMAPDFGNEWNYHPATLTLYDSTDSFSPYGSRHPNTKSAIGARGIGSSVTMKYRKLDSSSDSGNSHFLTEGKEWGTAGSHANETLDKGITGLIYDGSGGITEYTGIGENTKYVLSSYPAGTLSATVNGTATVSAEGGGCGVHPTCPAIPAGACDYSVGGGIPDGFTPADFNITPSASLAERRGGCCNNYYDRQNGTDVCLDYYYSGTCNYTCSGSASLTSEAYYRQIYLTKSESESGVYEIDTLSTDVSNRIEAIKEKFISTKTTAGKYLYYITDNGSTDFGTRACNLIVTGCDNCKWSDMIRYRIVDTDNMFPNRTPGLNWQGYDLSIAKPKSTTPMYVIKLSSSVMKNISKSSNFNDYVGWTLPSTYNPMDESGNYSSTGDYWNSFDKLKELGAQITRNDGIIKERNQELVSQGYNKYYKSIQINTNEGDN